MQYSHNFGSNFPNGLIPFGNKKDLDDSVKDLVAEYYSYLSIGDLNQANELYENNKETLEPYSIKMKEINRQHEEIYNIALYALNQIKSVISDKEPITQSEGSYWYVDY